MKYTPPPEITAIEAKIKELQDKRQGLYETWLNSVAPFKIDQKVKVTKGGRTRNARVIYQTLKYGDSWDYTVLVELKNGKLERQHIYSWEKIEALPSNTP